MYQSSAALRVERIGKVREYERKEKAYRCGGVLSDGPPGAVENEQRVHEQQQHVAVPEGVEAGHVSKDEAPAQEPTLQNVKREFMSISEAEPVKSRDKTVDSLLMSRPPSRWDCHDMGKVKHVNLSRRDEIGKPVRTRIIAVNQVAKPSPIIRLFSRGTGKLG